MMQRIMEQNPEIYANKVYKMISQPYAYTTRDLEVDKGRLAFIYSVNKEKAEKLQDNFEIIDKLGFVEKTEDIIPKEFYPKNKQILNVPVSNRDIKIEQTF